VIDRREGTPTWLNTVRHAGTSSLARLRMAAPDAHATLSLGSHSIQTLIANVLIAGIGVLSGILASRLLGPNGRGELAAIQSWPYLFATLSMLGLQDAIIFHGGQKREELGILVFSATALILCIGAVVAVLGYVGMPYLLAEQGAGVVRVARLYLLSIGAFALAGVPVFALRAQLRFAAWNAVRMLAPSTWLLTLLLYLARGDPEPQRIAITYLVVTLVVSCGLSVYGFRLLPSPRGVRPACWPRLWRFGVPVWLGTLPQYLNVRLDQLLMASFLPASNLGMYVTAVAWSSALTPVNSAFAAVLFPNVAATAAASDQRRAIRRALSVAGCSSVLGAGCMGLLARPVIPLAFGQRFEAAVLPAYVLLLAAVFSGLTGVLEEGLKGMGHPRLVMKAEVGGLVVTLAALLAFLKPLGALGAAIASLLSYGATFALLVRMYWALEQRSR
jgi:O-antigen/teichoic acid export membrane protein